MTGYIVTNSTVKEPRLDAAGKDQRTMLEKVGHAVQFSDDDKRPVVLQPGHHKFVHSLSSGILGLKQDGLVTVKVQKDISDALEAHTFKPDKSVKKPKPQISGASAKQMGEAPVAQEPVNPGGTPNFLVDPKIGAHRVRKGKNASDGPTQPDPIRKS